MNEEDWDKMLRRALLEAIRQDYQPILDSSDGFDHQYSLNYERKMRKLLVDPFRYAKRISRPLWKQVLQTAACILLAVSIGFAGILAISPDVRATVLHWVTQWYQEHVEFRFTGDADSETSDWEIGTLPEGYKEASKDDLFGKVNVIYTNEEYDEIDFTFMPISQGAEFNMDNEKYDVRETMINGMKAYVAQAEVSNKPNYIIWIDEKNQTAFRLISDIKIDALIEIAERVKKVKKNRNNLGQIDLLKRCYIEGQKIDRPKQYLFGMEGR